MIPKEAMIEIKFPESFRELSADEVHKAFQDNYDQRWGVRDEENHVIIVLQWNKANGLLAKISNIEGVCKEDEKKLSRAMRSNSYSLGSFFDGTVCGTQSKGFSYSYEIQGQKQYAQLIVFRNGNMFYKLYYYTRPELEEANRETWKGIMEGIGFISE